MSIPLPPAITRELGPLVQALALRDFVPVGCEQSDLFGNFEVTFARGRLAFALVRDRGQFHVGGVERMVLEPVGLWRSFSGPQALGAPLVAWIESRGPA